MVVEIDIDNILPKNIISDRDNISIDDSIIALSKSIKKNNHCINITYIRKLDAITFLYSILWYTTIRFWRQFKYNAFNTNHRTFSTM